VHDIVTVKINLSDAVQRWHERILYRDIICNQYEKSFG